MHGFPLFSYDDSRNARTMFVISCTGDGENALLAWMSVRRRYPQVPARAPSPFPHGETRSHFLVSRLPAAVLPVDPGVVLDWCGSVAIGVEIGVDRVAVVSLSDEFAVLDTTCLHYSADASGDVHGLVEPDSAVDAVFAAVSQIVLACGARGYEVGSLAFSASTEEAIIAVDETTMAMTPAINALDSSVAEIAGLISATDGDRIHRSTGIPVHIGSTVARIAWFIDNDDLLRHANWCGLKDYVASRFYGKLVGDMSTASSMGLLDRRRMDWSSAVLAPLGLRSDQLPPLVSSDRSFPLTEEAAELAGLRRGIPIVVGASGPCLAPLAMGLHRLGAVMVHPGMVGRLCALGHRPRGQVLSTLGVGDRWLLVGEDVDDLRAAGVDAEILRVAADMRQSPEVAVDIANALGLPVEISDVSEPLAVGAAALAWYTAGVLPSFDATAEMFQPYEVFHPQR
jgi:gluconokinase